MDRKFVHWIVLIVSIALIIGVCFLLIKNLSFFITRKDIKATVKLKSSYRKKIESFDESVLIYYSGLFPHDVYIQNCKVPKKGIIVLELIMLLVMCVAFKSGFDGVRGK